MINTAEILAAIQASTAMGQTALSSMSSSFIQGIPTMSMDAATTSSSITGGIQQAGTDMWAQMDAISKSVNAQVALHQQQQTAESTHDFKADMNDLRPTNARGFPQELDTDFFTPFRK